MSRRFYQFLVLLLWLMTAPGHASMEEVVVQGKRPGPPLWNVAHEGHDLWIFITINPVPDNFVWDSESTEFIVQGADRFLTPPEIRSGTLNPFKIWSAIRKYNRMKKLPDGETLQAALPPDDWQKLLELQALVGLPDSVQRLRPIMAVGKILDAGVQAEGLKGNRKIIKQLHKLAKKHDVEVIETIGDLHINDAIALLENINEDQELVCLQETLDAAGSYFQTLDARARSWADGEIVQARERQTAMVVNRCFDAILTTEAAEGLRFNTENRWLEQAVNSLETYPVTFTHLPIDEVVRDNGLLNRLKSRLGQR